MNNVNKYAEIIDKGECLSTINETNQFSWRDNSIKALAGRSEWLRHNFYPANGMVGLIVDCFENHLWRYKIYVLLINERFYVPMSQKGIKIITNVVIRDAVYQSEPSQPLRQKYDNYQHYQKASTYCNFAETALNAQRINNLAFNRILEKSILKIRFNGNFDRITFHELCEDIARFTKEDVLNDGDKWDDLNSVSWFMGIQCYVFKEALNLDDFRTLFVASWKKYFTSK